MIDPKSEKILFHSVNKKDGMLMQISQRIVTDLLDCIEDRLEKIVLHNETHEDQYRRIIGYRDQLMKHVTQITQ